MSSPDQPGGRMGARLYKAVDPPRRVSLAHDARRTWQGQVCQLRCDAARRMFATECAQR